MPGEAGAKGPNRVPNRWEGTHTYTRGGSKPRTVGQAQEEVAARIRADREKRRIGVEKLRRNSIAAFPSSSKTSNLNSDPEEEFFDADEMPGSNKKKRQASGREAPQEEAMETEKPGGGIDPEMRALLLSIKTDINASTNAAMERIDKRITENESAIRKVGADTAEEVRSLRRHVDESHAKLEAKLDKKLEERGAAIEKRIEVLESKAVSGSATKKLALVANNRKEEAYFKCRRSLKAWPVDGGDLVDSFRVFMRTKLGIDDQRIATIGELNVVKSTTRAARDRKEVLITFEDKEVRDFVKSTGPSLAGDSSAGMAIHVPGHLLDNYYALSSVGYNIKTSHAGTKRSIKFDDAKMDLFLDICINGQWKRITPDEAKQALKTAPVPNLPGGSRSLTASDLNSLMHGEPVEGLTAVVIPADGQEERVGE